MCPQAADLRVLLLTEQSRLASPRAGCVPVGVKKLKLNRRALGRINVTLRMLREGCAVYKKAILDCSFKRCEPVLPEHV